MSGVVTGQSVIVPHCSHALLITSSSPSHPSRLALTPPQDTHDEYATCGGQHLSPNVMFKASGGFRGGRAGSAPPPLGRRTDTVTVLLVSDNCKTRTSEYSK